MTATCIASGSSKAATSPQSIVVAGHVRLDGKRVLKPHEEVRAGAIVALPLGDQVRMLRVIALPNRRGPAAEARSCYEEVGVDEAAARS